MSTIRRHNLKVPIMFKTHNVVYADKFNRDPLDNILRAEEAAAQAVDDYFGSSILPNQRKAMIRTIRTRLLMEIVK